MHPSSFSRAKRRVAAATAFLALSAACSAVARANDVIVLNSAEATLSVIDEATHQVVRVMPTGKEPHHLMPTPDNRSLIVADSVSNDLMFLDPKTGRLQRRVDGIEDPYQLGFSPDGKWFVTTGLRLDRLDIYHRDPATNALSLARRLPLATMPSHMAFTKDDRIVFVTLQISGQVAAVDLLTQTLLWKMPVGKTPAGLWLTPNDRYLLVGMTGEDDVAVVDWRNRTVVKRIKTGDGAHNFRSLDDGRRVAVSNRVANTISIIDEQALTNVGDITGLMPGPDDMELTADKRYMWVTFRFARHVGLIDLRTRHLVQTVAVGRSPHGIYCFDRAPVKAPNGG